MGFAETNSPIRGFTLRNMTIVSTAIESLYSSSDGTH